MKYFYFADEEGSLEYNKAMKILNETKPNMEVAYAYMQTSADLGHKDAKEKMAWASLFGRHIKQNLTYAYELFHELASTGNPDAQMVIF